MKRLLIVLFIGIMIIALQSLTFADLNQFEGRWENTDSNTRGITALEIHVNGTAATIRAWGQCHPRDCDWGTVTARTYAASVDSRPESASTLLASFTTNFNQTLVIIKQIGGGQLQADVLTRFTDNSHRTSYTNVYTFRRSHGGPNGPGPGGPNGPGPGGPNGPGPGNQNLMTPQQISPANGTVFRNYPRTTKLIWQSVPGAQSYTVEIDCFGCAQAGRWSTDVGRTYLVVPNLTSTSYTFNFVGAQPGRWRVWAVGDHGRQSAKSSWWEFRYTR